MKEKIEFRSEGVRLRGFFHQRGTSERLLPVLVMAPGFGGLVIHSIGKFAESFAAAGFNVLVYDNRNFGESEGLPRQEADPVLQRRAYRDAISFAQTLPGVDPSRVGLWGSSYSGGHVIEIAAIDRRVACIVAQVPTISGYTQALRRTAPGAVASQLARFDADRADRFEGRDPVTLPMVAEDSSQPCAFPGKDAFDYYSVPGFTNEITLRSLEMARENEPGIYVSQVSPTPMLMIVASRDTVTPTDLALEAYNRALEPKQLVMVEGGHFSPYGKHFKVTSTAAKNWFRRHLLD